MMGPVAVHRYLGTEHSTSSFETQSCDNQEHTDHTLFHNFVNIDLKPENASIDGIHYNNLCYMYLYRKVKYVSDCLYETFLFWITRKVYNILQINNV